MRVSTDRAHTFAALTRAGQTRRLRDLAERALQAYDIRPARLTRMAEGWNAAFRVDAEDGARYLLRVHRAGGPSEAEVRGELTWLTALRRDTDLGVPEPVATRDGALLTLAATPGVPEPRVCDLLRWLDGRFVQARLTPGHLHRVGQLTGRLQEHGAGMVDLRRRRVDDPCEVAAAQDDNLSDEVIDHATDLVAGVHSVDGGPVVRAVLEMARRARDRLPADAFGLIHADLHQENYLFLDGAIRVIDFDDCGVGPYVYDLAVTLSEVRYLREREPALRAALYAGYREIRPLPTAHEELVDAYVALRFLQLMLYEVEHRDEPMFRDGWRDHVADLLGLLHRLAAA